MRREYRRMGNVIDSSDFHDILRVFYALHGGRVYESVLSVLLDDCILPVDDSAEKA